MKPRTYSTEGIVLARKNYGEADRILSVFTKDKGRVGLIAKGVRRTSSRKRGHIEIFSRIKFSGVSSHNLDIMTEAEVIEYYPEVRTNLNKISLAYYFMEIVGRATHENENHKEVYDLLVKFLEQLKENSNLKEIKTDFIYNLLIELGFWPKGRIMTNPDNTLEEVLERKISSVRVGKKLLN